MTDDKDDDKTKVIPGITVLVFLLFISAIGLGPLAIWDVIQACKTWQ